MNHDRCPNCEAYTEELDALRADLARALVANADHAAELARVEKANAILRAECDAARECWIICNHEYTISGEKVDALAAARAATDAAGILKGGES